MMRMIFGRRSDGECCKLVGRWMVKNWLQVVVSLESDESFATGFVEKWDV
jgi:hypothetical protein